MQVFKILTGEHAPGPPRVLLLLKLLIINFAEKLRLKKVTKIGALSLKKILNAPLT